MIFHLQRQKLVLKLKGIEDLLLDIMADPFFHVADCLDIVYNNIR